MGISSSVVPLGLARLKRSSNWRSLEDWNWRERITFVSFGVTTSLQVTEPAALLSIKYRLPPGWRETRHSEVEPEYSLVVGNEAAPPGLGWLHLLFRGNSLISAAYKLEPVLGALESELDGRVAYQAAPERIFVRAGVVRWRGSAIVVCGAPQSGTSALIAALLKAGASYYSDQFAVFDGDGLVYPYARPLWLHAGAQANAVRYRPEELGARTGTQALAVGTLIFSSYRPESRPRFVALTAGSASAELLADTSAAQTHPQAAQAAIGKALAVASILKGVRGEAEDLLELLLGPGHKRGAH